MNTETSCIITRLKAFKTVQVGGHSTWPFVILAANCYNVRNCTSPTNGVCKATDICQCNPGFIGNRDTVLYMLLLIEISAKKLVFSHSYNLLYKLVLFSLLKFAMVTGTGRKKGLASQLTSKPSSPNPWEVDRSTGILAPTLYERHCGISWVLWDGACGFSPSSEKAWMSRSKQRQHILLKTIVNGDVTTVTN